MSTRLQKRRSQILTAVNLARYGNIFPPPGHKPDRLCNFAPGVDRSSSCRAGSSWDRTPRGRIRRGPTKSGLPGNTVFLKDESQIFEPVDEIELPTDPKLTGFPKNTVPPRYPVDEIEMTEEEFGGGFG